MQNKTFNKKQLNRIPFPIDTAQVPKHLLGLTYEQYLNDLQNYTYFIMGNGPV